MSRPVAVVSVLVLLCIPTLTFAQWIADGNPVSTAVHQQNYPVVIGDTEGGVIVAWTTNEQGGVNYDLFIERYDGFGQRLWSAGGVTVAALANNQWKPALVADSLGGAYITWEDNRSGNYDVYAQHFDAGGTALWDPNGRVVCNDGADQGGSATEGPKIVRSDVKDADTDLVVPGVIICWQDYRNAGSAGTDVYAQRMAAGGAAWTANGVVVCGQSDSQASVQMVSDGSEGGIVVWSDARGAGGNDIYAQRIDSGGVSLWATEGEPVCTAADAQSYPRAVRDGQGGAYVAWIDHRLGLLTPYSAYIQRIDRSGGPVWTVNGIQLYGSVEVDSPELALDATGGVIACWRDARLGNVNLFAQRLTEYGTKRWTALGEAVTTNAGNDARHQVSRDGEGGLYVVWENYTPSARCFIQRLDSTGTASFGAGGQYVTGSTGTQNSAAVCIDDTQPAFVAWGEVRTGGNNTDLYLTRIYHDATGVETPAAASALHLRAFPNPFNAATELAVGAPGPGSVSVELFDVAGRRVARRTIVAGPGGNASLLFDGRGDDGRALPSGVYFVRARTAGLTQTAKIVLMR
jgi:hypothetical protein